MARCGSSRRFLRIPMLQRRDLPVPVLVSLHASSLPLDNGLYLCTKSTFTRLRLPRVRAAFTKQKLNFLNSLPASLGVGEEGLHSGAETEDAEDDECFVGDVQECRRDEKTEREVEEPVGDCCE